jgi:hypothetical protein
MSQKVLIGLKWFFSFAFLYYTFVYVLNVIQPELIYHAQQPAFYFNSVFFSTFVDYPGGLSEYIGCFLAQSFHIPLLGSLVIVLICAFYLLLVRFIKNKYVGDNEGFFLIFIPILIAIYLLHDYYLPYNILIKAIFSYATYSIFLLLIKKKKVVIIIVPIVSFCLYYIAGGAAFSVFLIAITIHYLFYEKLSFRFIIPFIALICLTLIPYISFKFLFNITSNNLWFWIIPDLPVIIKYNPNIALYCLFAYIPVLVLYLSLIAAIQNKTDGNKTIIEKISKWRARINSMIFKYFVTILLSAIIIFSFNFLNSRAFDQHKKNIVLVDYYSENNEWQKVIDLALSDDYYDIFINYDYNRAIYHLDNFVDMFFKYPQRLGSDGLYPDKIVVSQIAMPASDLYYDIGYISEALHWAYEAQSSSPYNHLIIERLVKCNLIEGKYMAAKTLLSILDDSFYNNEFVRKYMPYTEDTLLACNDPEILDKRSEMPVGIEIPSSSSLRFKQLYLKNNNNKLALELLAMTYLLEHKLGDFMQLYPDLRKVYNNKIPVTYEIAAILYTLKTKTASFNEKEYSEEAKQLFLGFNETYKRNKGNKSAAQYALMNSYGNTYLYYISFLSPLVTKSSLKTRNVY